MDNDIYDLLLRTGGLLGTGFFASKPGLKLIEYAGDWFIKPGQIKREAKAQGEAAITMAYANAKIKIIEDNAENELTVRARHRLEQQSITEQSRVESILSRAIPHIKETISDKPVDEEWRIRFFNQAKDISTEELQEVYAKILANEINESGNFSLRTLDTLRNLSPDEAQLFNKAAALSNNLGVIFKIPKSEGRHKYDFSEFGLSFGDVLSLRDAGLIEYGDSGAHRYDGNNFGKADGWYYQWFDYREKRLTLYKRDNKSFILDTYNLTRAGKELLSISKVPDNTKYLELLGAALDLKGFVTKIYDLNSGSINDKSDI